MRLLRTEWGGLDFAALFSADEAHAGHTNAHGAEAPLANERRQARTGFRLLARGDLGSNEGERHVP
jgi:hypothetical protein